MKNHQLFLLCIMTTTLPTELVGQKLTISQDGVYQLGLEVNYAPTNPDDSIVLITASDVTLDLAGHNISQSNSVANLNGIVVMPNLQNITIKNGTIMNITGTGISIGAGCSRISIDSIETFSCDQAGITFNGTTASPIRDSSINNCKIVSCCQGVNADYAFSMTECLRTTVEHIDINNCGSTAHNLTGLNLSNCSQCMFNTIRIVSNNASSQLKSFGLSTVQFCQFIHCFAQNNSTSDSSSSIIGFAFESAPFSSMATIFNEFEHCTVLGNSVTAASSTSVGFSILDNNDDNFFKNCRSRQNNSTDVCNSFSLVNNARNLFIDCISQNNRSSGAGTAGTTAGFNLTQCVSCKLVDCLSAEHNGTTVAGYLLSGSNNCNFIRCLSSDNVGTTLSSGFRADSTITCVYQECLAMRNLGPDDTNSYGFNISNDADSMFVKNLAMRNCLTGNNATAQARQFTQVADFGAGAIQNNNVTNQLNTNTNGNSNPWTNFGIPGTT